MSLLRDSLALLLTLSLAGCHAGFEHGYLRGGPSLSIAGRPQLSIERVQTASFRPGLPPSELAQVRLERWPRSMPASQTPTDATMNWPDNTFEPAQLNPGSEVAPDGNATASVDGGHASDNRDFSDETLPSNQPLEAATVTPPKEITYRRPVVRIGLLDAFRQRLQSGGKVLERKAGNARDWCRATGRVCDDRRCELQTQFGEVWDEVNPQFWVESACRSCGERTQHFSSALKERANDVCCPSWIEPARDRLSSACDHLSGGLSEATDDLERVRDQFNDATDDLNNLQPLSDFRPAVTLPNSDLKGFLPPILNQPGQHPGPPADDATSVETNSSSTNVIELPPPADRPADSAASVHSELPDRQPDSETALGNETAPDSETAPENEAARADNDDASATSDQAPTAGSRRAARKTDRWKRGPIRR